MDALERMFRDERENLDFLIQEEMNEMQTLEQAWHELQATPSYVERYANRDQEPYMTELAFRLKLGNAFFYYHQECGVPSHQYTNVDRYYLAEGAVCMGCHGLLSEAPVLE